MKNVKQGPEPISVIETKPLTDIHEFVEKQELTKHERFLKYAGGRAASALRAIELIGNCSNLQSYEYTQDEVSAIFAQLRETIDETEKKFEHKPKQRFGRNFFQAQSKDKEEEC